MRAVGKEMLELLGFSVLTACDGREAVILFKQHHDVISVVLLDMTMPNMGGVETLKHIRDIEPAAVVVLSSGYNQESSVPATGQCAPSGFVQKPYELNMLRKTLGQILA